MSSGSARVSAIDLFCGAGGLSYGLQTAGIPIIAGIDIDPHCRYPFESNIDAAFLQEDIADVTAEQLAPLWIKGSVRVLAGCAPCSPFSPYRRGVDTSLEKQWPLLGEFGRIVEQTMPEIVTMENVPRIGSSPVFKAFVKTLEGAGYYVAWRSCRGPDYGLAQNRRRLVLLASRLGPIEVPGAAAGVAKAATVRARIGKLPPIEAGMQDPKDPLHTARALTDVNLRRIRASTPGGTWKEWPTSLRAPCHQRSTGATFRNVYARMEWDKPSPTITTLAHSFGTGRFGHPEQDRPISLREAAMLQGFPKTYRFVMPGERIVFGRLGRLIGNAVPPPLAEAVGVAIVAHVAAHDARRARG